MTAIKAPAQGAVIVGRRTPTPVDAAGRSSASIGQHLRFEVALTW